MRLDLYNNMHYDRGATKFKELLWLFSNYTFFSSWIPGSVWRVKLLRLFGAKIGYGVIIKPCVRVKFPWRLIIGDHCWLGEDLWIDNLADVKLGNHVCLSQGVYLCTGSHDWSKATFDLVVKSITIESHVWVGAMCKVAPGVTIGEGAVVTVGSVVNKSLKSWIIYGGHPVVPIKPRSINDN